MCKSYQFVKNQPCVDTKMKLVNIACGSRYNEAWINVDFQADSSNVKKMNVLAGLPYEDQSIDVIYSSHFLEHLSLKDGKSLLNEIYRVLKDGGIVRIAVPDLENICHEYLDVLGKALVDEKYAGKHEWITMELLDQLTRVENGGEMNKMFKKITRDNNKELSDYILYRTGDELLKNDVMRAKHNITIDKIKNKLLYLYLSFIKKMIPKQIRKQIVADTSIGEKHLCMFDRYSLKKNLNSAGFKNVSFRRYNESLIPNFNDYLLDIKEDGTPYKGACSLYVESVK